MYGIETEVSIPKRVSEALKRDRCFFYAWQVCVSIPKRVSEALKPTPVEGRFNGISGVSIPKRVSEALKPGPTQADS